MVMAAVQGLLDTTVTIEPWTAQDQHGIATYGAPQTVAARIEQGVYTVYGANGQSLVGKYKVLLGVPVMVDPRDRVTLPAGYGVRDATGVFVAISPVVMSVEPVYYRGGHDHTVLMLGA